MGLDRFNGLQFPHPPRPANGSGQFTELPPGATIGALVSRRHTPMLLAQAPPGRPRIRPRSRMGKARCRSMERRNASSTWGIVKGDWMGRARAGRDEQQVTYTCTLPMALCAHTNHVLQVPVDAIAMRQGELSWDNTSPR